MYTLKDTERESLVNKMAELLDEYDYDYNRIYLYEIVDEWAENKGTLIELFQKHPNYIDGEFMIAFDSDFNREINIGAISCFVGYLKGIMMNTDLLPEEINKQRIIEGCNLLPQSMYDFIAYRLSDIRNQFLTEEQAEIINQIFPVKAAAGQKTSRAVNKIMTYLGYSKDSDYNREFAKYADALNPLKIKRHTVLSLNPLDYYTMSFGNSWASCHTIDKQNKRGMPNNYSGCYSSGTESYMLDGTSMVFYTVDASYEGTEYYTQPKINRQMFHFGEDKLIQGRLYPQDNDSNAEGYEPYRNIVQSIMAEILEVPNLWKLTKGTSAASRWIDSIGTHYQDYEHYSNCTLSILNGSENEEYLIVGHSPICPNCGEWHDFEENIMCEGCAGYICADCGRRVSNDDVIWIDGKPFCRECVEYCEECETYHRGESTYISDSDIYVCNYCRNEYYGYCDECGEWYDLDRITYIESEDRYVCEHCVEEYYTRCEECGEYFRSGEMTEIDGCFYCKECAEDE